MGPVPVKGLSEPVEVYELVGVGPGALAAAGRGRARADPVRRPGRRAGAAPPGARAAPGAGHGQVVAIVGEPGVGQVAARLGVHPLAPRPTAGSCSQAGSVSYGKATPYLPVIDLLKGYFAIEDATTPRRDAREGDGQAPDAGPGAGAQRCRRSWRCSTCPSTTPRGTRSTRRSAASARWTRSSGCCCGRARSSRCCCVFEDLHWIDSETQALLDSLVESLPAARHPAPGQLPPGVPARLGQQDLLHAAPARPAAAGERRRAARRAARATTPASTPLKRVLIERTEGNPFFLEESVRTLVETGALVGRARGLPAGASRSQTIAGAGDGAGGPGGAHRPARRPRTSGCSRRPRSSGRTCRSRCSRPSPTCPRTSLRRGLGRLQAAEFLYETSLFPDLEYTFKHALTHEVAYGSLLQERRRAPARADRGGHRAALPRSAGRARRAAGAPCVAGRGVGQGGAPTSGRPGARRSARSAYREAVALLRAGAGGAARTCPRRARRSSGRSTCGSTSAHALLPLGELQRSLGASRRKPRAGWPNAGRSATARMGSSAYMSGHHLHTGGHVTEVRTLAQTARPSPRRSAMVRSRSRAVLPRSRSPLQVTIRATEQICRNRGVAARRADP